MTNFFAENVNLLCEKAGISVDQLAKRIGLTPSTLYRHINPDPGKKEKTAPRKRTILAVADYFGLPPKSVLEEKLTDENLPEIEQRANQNNEGENTVKSPLVPLINMTMFFGIMPLISPIIEPEFRDPQKERPSGLCVEEWIPAPPFANLGGKDLVAILVDGEAMLPFLSPGDIAYIELNRSNEAPDEYIEYTNVKNNDLVLASDKKRTPLLRKIITDESGKKWLVKENDNWPGEKIVESGEIFGKIVAKAACFD